MKHLTVSTAPQCNSSIELMADRLALESATLADFTSMLGTTIPALAFNLKASFEKSLTNVRNYLNSFSADSKLNTLVSTIPYATLASIKAYVPEGFSGNALEYVQLLEQQLNHANNVVAETLTPYNTFLSGILSNPEATKSSAGKSMSFLHRDQARQDLNEQTGTFFKNGTQTADKFSKFYRQNNEILTVQTKVKLLSEMLKQSDIRVIQRATEDTLELVAALQSSHKLEELKQASPQVIKLLGEMTLNAAREVEFYAIVRYRVEAFIKCFEDSLEVLNKFKQ